MYVYLLAHNKHWNLSFPLTLSEKHVVACTQSNWHYWLTTVTRPKCTSADKSREVHWVHASSADYGLVRLRTVIRRFFALSADPMIADADYNPRTPIHSFRTPLDRPHVARCIVRSHHSHQWLTQLGVDSWCILTTYYKLFKMHFP